MGKLIYLNHTRRDIKFMHNPKDTHLHAARRVLAYLKGTISQGLLFKRGGGTSLRSIQMLIMIGMLLIEYPLLVIECSSMEILSLGEARRKMLLLDLVPK